MRERHLVECFINKIKHFTRYLGFLQPLARNCGIFKLEVRGARWR